jgi:rubrerythrin
LMLLAHTTMRMHMNDKEVARMEHDLRALLDENDRAFVHPIKPIHGAAACADNSIQAGDCVLECSACGVIFHGAATSRDCPVCHKRNVARRWKR